MRKASIWLAVAGLALAAGVASATGGDAPAVEPALEYELVEGWAGTPEEVGMVSAVDVDAQGNVYAFRREANDVWKLDSSGAVLESWDQDFAEWAHGIRVDPEGFVWTVDGQGHQVKKWSPDGGELLMTLGRRGVAGDGPDTFDRPTDVAFGPDGEFFVSDGYANTRVVKFDRDGNFIKAWGTPGTEPGQFDLPHTIVVDARNRVMVGDRENARIQIFDLDGNLLEVWDHLGSPYGLYVTPDDRLYVADLVNARVWIADAEDGELLGTIEGTQAIHWIAVDRSGSVYAATPATARYWDDPADVWYLRKYQRVTTQQEAHAHLLEVVDPSVELVENVAFLTQAQAEAGMAAEHAGYGAGGYERPGDLQSMKTHAAHVLHTLDPDRVESGPGFGFGLLAAGRKAIEHVEMAAESPDATDNIRTHARHVTTCVRNALERAERMVTVAEGILAAETAEEADPLADELEELVTAVRNGVDADGDGRITWREGEGGLWQAERHMQLMFEGEGIGTS